MKLFDYPDIDVQFSQQVPSAAQSCIEWRETSIQDAINRHLNGESQLRTLIESGQQWTYHTVPEQQGAFEVLTAARELTNGSWRKSD